MTIAIIDNRVQYTADGAQQDFPFEFRILQEEDMIVATSDQFGNIMILDAGEYNITGVDSENGNVNILIPPANGLLVTLYRSVEPTQLTDYVDYDPFPAETHERALDKLTMITQQLQEQVDRAIVLDPTSTDEQKIYIDIGTPDERKYSVLSFNEDGTKLQAEYEIGHYKGNWSSGSQYSDRQTLTDPATSNLYLVTTDHIADSIANDVAAGNLILIMDFGAIVAYTAQCQASAAEALASEQAAAASESNASDSELSAGLSATDAATSEVNSYNWAQADEDVPVDDGTHPEGFSAYHYAQKAEDILAAGGNIAIARAVDVVSSDFITDLNQMDYTGDQFADPTVPSAILVSINNSMSVTYQGALYQYQGVKPTKVGLGGTTQVLGDWAILATGSAGSTDFDPSSSTLNSTNVQDAIDEADVKIEANAQAISDNDTAQSDALAAVVSDIGRWNYTARAASFQADHVEGFPTMFDVTAPANVTIPAKTAGGYKNGDVISITSTDATFPTIITTGLTIEKPDDTQLALRINNSVITLMYKNETTLLAYGDLAAL